MKKACLLAFTLAAIVSCAGPLKQTEIPVLDSYAATDRWVTDHIAYVPDVVPWWKIDDWRPAAEIIARGYGDCDDLTLNGDDDLKAACQRCHLQHDAKQNAENARKTREKKSGQISLFSE